MFCGAGGASVGYHRAGFDVVGVDIAPQRNYPFTFVQADALEYLDGLCWGELASFAAIHASPPCQRYSKGTSGLRAAGVEYADLLPATREALTATGLPWIIENVPGAPMRVDYALCGCQFGLPGLRRERWFESSWHGFELRPHHDHTSDLICVVGHGTPRAVREKLGRNPSIVEYRAAMGIDWMNRGELSQAIPPAYTEHLGKLIPLPQRFQLEGEAA